MDKKTKVRSGFYFGLAMTLFFILQDLLTHDELTTRNIIITIVSGLIGGALAGFLFGWLMGLFAHSKGVTQGARLETHDNETILFETGANHFKGAEAVGGKLYLTDKRLVFKSHKFNIQNHEWSIRLSDINEVSTYKTLGIMNNGLSVKTVDHGMEKFVVQQAGQWLHFLNEKTGAQAHPA